MMETASRKGRRFTVLRMGRYYGYYGYSYFYSWANFVLPRRG